MYNSLFTNATIHLFLLKVGQNWQPNFNLASPGLGFSYSETKVSKFRIDNSSSFDVQSNRALSVTNDR